MELKNNTNYNILDHLKVNNIYNPSIETELNEFIERTPQIKQLTRRKEVVAVRHYLYFAYRKYTNLSYKAIGKKLGKDHATIMHGENKAKIFLNIKDSFFMETTKEIRNIIELAVKNNNL
jgi:chromosomal replication initiation ATPase DnaA